MRERKWKYKQEYVYIHNTGIDVYKRQNSWYLVILINDISAPVSIIKFWLVFPYWPVIDTTSLAIIFLLIFSLSIKSWPKLVIQDSDRLFDCGLPLHSLTIFSSFPDFHLWLLSPLSFLPVDYFLIGKRNYVALYFLTDHSCCSPHSVSPHCENIHFDQSPSGNDYCKFGNHSFGV